MLSLLLLLRLAYEWCCASGLVCVCVCVCVVYVGLS